MTRPVFVDNLTPPIQQLRVGDYCTLGGSEGRHGASVKRLRSGEELDVVDGRGLRLTCQVVDASKETLNLVVTALVHEAPPVQTLTLVQALAKGGRDEQAIEQATEIGVDQVIAWAAQRSEVHWRGPKVERGRSKWAATVHAAAKQSRRAFIPRVEGPLSLEELARWVHGMVTAGGVCLLCHEEASEPMTRILGHVSTQQDVAVIVGPEGGVSETERDTLVQAGASLTLLGPHVLRSASAGPAALTLVSAALGRWSR